MNNNTTFSPLFQDRFWKKVDKRGPNDCWNWTAVKHERGYGHMEIQNKNYKTHRLSWEFINGKIPDGLCCLHKCDNTSCCNPAHLFLGTQRDNMRDMVQKGRNNPRIGTENGNSKLSEQNVLEIRKLHHEGMKNKRISIMYKVSETTICHVVNRKTWKHV